MRKKTSEHLVPPQYWVWKALATLSSLCHIAGLKLLPWIVLNHGQKMQQVPNSACKQKQSHCKGTCLAIDKEPICLTKYTILNHSTKQAMPESKVCFNSVKYASWYKGNWLTKTFFFSPISNPKCMPLTFSIAPNNVSVYDFLNFWRT